MKHRGFRSRELLAAVMASLLLFAGSSALAQQGGAGNGSRLTADKARVVNHWTQSRRDAAIPRDFVIGPNGLGYLRRADGSLEPYGREANASGSAGPTPQSRPAANGSDQPPSIADMIPAEGDVIGASAVFSATVTDDSSVRSVTVVIQYPNNGPTQSFQAANTGNDTWSVSIQGFSDGSWSWWIDARDDAKRGGNRTVSKTVNFTVDTGGGSGGGSSGGSGGSSDTVTSSEWGSGGVVQTAAGRLYFEMPNNAKRKGPWIAYVCSGTVVTDSRTGRSVVLTAGHCVYDDANKAFARNVLFIPDQADTWGSGTDTNCGNDPLGCWVPGYGVVDVNFTTRTFPGNEEWDYAYYVVDDSGAHAGTAVIDDALDGAVTPLGISFSTPSHDDGVAGASSTDFTHALGYSYNADPRLMYCAEDMTTIGTVNWWLPSCLLSGGSSGGPWIQPMDESTGSGFIVSVNSWGYTNSAGMAGPMLSGTSASCIFDEARLGSAPTGTVADGDAGTIVVNCP